MKGRSNPVRILTVFCIFSVIIMVLSLIFGRKSQEAAAFTPPPFEPSAVFGTPNVPEDLGYSSPYASGMSYRFSVCGKVKTVHTEATVYLTNPEGNAVWLKLRVLDDNGNMLGETGLIKPGEYVQTVRLSRELSSGTTIKLKIMGYVPDTYQSAGATTLETTVIAAE